MTYRQCAFICLLGIYEAAKFVVPTWNFQPLPNLGARKEFAGEPQAKAFRSSFKYSRLSYEMLEVLGAAPISRLEIFLFENFQITK